MGIGVWILGFGFWGWIDFKIDTFTVDIINQTALSYGRYFLKIENNANNTEIVRLIEQEQMTLQKCVAFAMGHHKRLGVVSIVVQLQPEVLRMVLAAV